MSTEVKLNVTPEQVKSILDKIVGIGGFVVKWTPNDVDNKIFDLLSNFVNQEWFPLLIIKLLDMFDPDKPVTKEDAVKAFNLLLK